MIRYEIYVDAILNKDGLLINSDGTNKPAKEYLLSYLVQKYKNYNCNCGWPPQYNLSTMEKIRDAVKPLNMIMNIAIGGAWENGVKCGGQNCSGCLNDGNDIKTGVMKVKYVEVWK